MQLLFVFLQPVLVAFDDCEGGSEICDCMCL